MLSQIHKLLYHSFIIRRILYCFGSLYLQKMCHKKITEKTGCIIFNSVKKVFEMRQRVFISGHLIYNKNVEEGFKGSRVQGFE